jgi:hypothetical protein
VSRREDPDETEGRALSRAEAEKDVWLADWLAGRRRGARLIEADEEKTQMSDKPCSVCDGKGYIEIKETGDV